eukprot:2872587-Prorocentrum_lima.AAC.1
MQGDWEPSVAAPRDMECVLRDACVSPWLERAQIEEYYRQTGRGRLEDVPIETSEELLTYK